MESQDRKSVPKFSSFKAPILSSHDIRPERRPDRPQDDRKSRHRSRRHGEGRSRSPRRSERRGRQRSSDKRCRSRSPRPTTHRDHGIAKDHVGYSANGDGERRAHENTVASIANERSTRTDDPAGDLFVIDLKGDRHNLVYGTTHRYAVPTYRRSGRGQVLGADPRYRIDRDHLDSDSLVLRMKDSLSSNSFKSAKSLSKRVSRPVRLFRVKVDDDSPHAGEIEQDFVSLEPAMPDGINGAPQNEDSGDERHGYRSIHGKAKEEDVIPRYMEIDEDNGNENQGSLGERKALHAELTRAVHNDPTDVSGWLRLIHHQELLILGDDDLRPLTYNEQQSVADVKLSLYEKGIKQCVGSPHKHRLILGRLQECACLWDTKKLLDEWNKALRESPECISLWISYLNFRQTDFQNFDFERLTVTFTECLNLNASVTSNTSRHQIQCYLFLRMTLFLREAGYLELAVGLWQAVLEFVCFKPESLSEKVEEHVVSTSFRDYWEGELPRLGEKGSLTWRGSVTGQASNHHVYPLHILRHCIEPSLLMESWEETESERTQAFRLPSRTLDQLRFVENGDDQEQYVDDPYSVVLFSDLAHMLKLFQNFDCVDELVDSFLYFCQLPHFTRPKSSPTTRLWAGDNFIRNESMDHVEPRLTRWTADNEQSTSPLHFPSSNFAHTTCTLFADPNDWFDSFFSWRESSQSPESSVLDTEWVQMTLRTLVERGSSREGFDEELAEYTLALILASSPIKAKKYAKTLLKKWTSSLRVCNALALIEWRNNSPSAAAQVWSSSISWSQQLPEDTNVEVGILWNSWIWELLRQNDHSRASYVLHAIPLRSIDTSVYANIESPSKPSNPTSTVQVQSFLREYQARSIGLGKLHSFVAFTDCLALLLFVEKYPIQTALDAYSSAVLRLSDLRIEDRKHKSYVTELLHQARARLLFFNHRMKFSRLTPIEIRDTLQESISLFPHNTIFLSLFTWNESRFNILDRIRNVHLLAADPETRFKLEHDSTLSLTAVQSAPVTTHLLSIWSELCRPIWAGSTKHSVRGAFERALGDDSDSGSLRSGIRNMHTRLSTGSARTNIMIWKLYIIFEVYHTQDIGAAKAVFYRAIRACPWSKQLFMLAFQHLQDEKVHRIIQGKSKSSGFIFEDLYSLYRTMTEKQLRIHVDIEDKIQNALANRQDNVDYGHSSSGDNDHAQATIDH